MCTHYILILIFSFDSSRDRLCYIYIIFQSCLVVNRHTNRNKKSMIYILYVSSSQTTLFNLTVKNEQWQVTILLSPFDIVLHFFLLSSLWVVNQLRKQWDNRCNIALLAPPLTPPIFKMHLWQKIKKFKRCEVVINYKPLKYQ